MAPSDDFSPYDPAVADAPEDIKRVGNDHEELHNAKLSPDGYYTGFFHKDFEGNYAQKKHHKAKKHHGRRHQRGSHYLQMRDHNKDTDDIVDNEDYVQNRFDHEHDTDDVVEEFSDENKLQVAFDHENDSDDVVQEFSDMDQDGVTRGNALKSLSQVSAQE